MPQGPQQISRKVSTAPSGGFLSRMFGTEEIDPNMQQGIDIARKEMPDMAPVKPYGFFSRLAASGSNAYVSGGDNIYMNTRSMQGHTPQEVADTMRHEQEHIRQKKSEGYGPSMQLLRSMFSAPREAYHQRPDEMAAFQAEKERRHSMGRMQTPIPSFSGNYYTPQDVNLPNPVKPRMPVPTMQPKTMY